MTQYVTEKIENLEQPITAWLFISIAVLLLGAYIFFVNGAIAQIVSARDTQAQISEIGGRIGSLESQLLAAQSQIVLADALARGFTESTDTLYITREPASLSFNR